MESSRSTPHETRTASEILADTATQADTSAAMKADAARLARIYRPRDGNAPPHCETCRYFHHESATCRRYAPYLAGPHGNLVPRWPDVAATDFCGEHAAL